MFEIKKNNYYRCLGTGKDFTVEIDPVTRDTKSYCEELILNAQEMYDQKEGDLYCLYSGGIDSELVMDVFLSQGMKITPVIVKLGPKYNDHDLTWATEYCNKKYLSPLIINIDVENFIKSGEILNIAKLAETPAYAFLATIKAALSLNGTVISGQDEPYISLGDIDNKWYFVEKERWSCWAKLYDKGLLNGTSSFLSWSAETLLSFMKEPTIQLLGNNQLPGKLGTFSSRKEVYGRMFPVPDRPKYTGWEYVDNSELFQHEYMQEVVKLEEIYSGEFKIEFNDLIRQLSR
jgi:hypothetical protein